MTGSNSTEWVFGTCIGQAPESIKQGIRSFTLRPPQRRDDRHRRPARGSVVWLFGNPVDFIDEEVSDMCVDSAIVDVHNRVFSVVKEVLAIDDNSMRLDASLKEDLGASSLDRLTLFLALQDEFGGSVSVDEAEGMTTLRDIVDYIRKRLECEAVTQ